jgi:large-conductance mechanosensitive channel
MNSFLPENVNYGNPNLNPTNFILEAKLEQQKTEQFSPPFLNQNNSQTDNQQPTTSSNKNNNFFENYNINNKYILSFLNLKNLTILTFASAIAIGLTLKDLINSFVFNIFQPLLMSIIIFFDKNSYLSITTYLKEKNPQIDFARFLGSLLIVRLVVVFMYLLNTYSYLFF